MGLHNMISNHARHRCQQRGVSFNVIESILANHDLDAAIGDECRVLRVSRDAAHSFALVTGDRQTAERMPNLAIIWSDRTGRVVTVIHDGGNRAARRYRVGR